MMQYEAIKQNNAAPDKPDKSDKQNNYCLESAIPLVLSNVVQAKQQSVLHIARDDVAMERLSKCLEFFSPDIQVIKLPSWDSMPYDRISPNGNVMAQRLCSLSRLVSANSQPRIIIITANALLQRLIPQEVLEKNQYEIKVGGNIEHKELISFLVNHSYSRVSTIAEKGEFAVRGSIIDIFPSTIALPIRIDLFGNEIETLKAFNPETQITEEAIDHVMLLPASEVILSPENIGRFKQNYRQHFGAVTNVNPLYEAVSGGAKYPGMEQMLPLFYPHLTNIFDYVPGCLVTQDYQVGQILMDRIEFVNECFQARQSLVDKKNSSDIGHYLLPDELYLGKDELEKHLNAREVIAFSPFKVDNKESESTPSALGAGYRAVENFHLMAKQRNGNVFELLKQWWENQRKPVFISCLSEGSRDRIGNILQKHGMPTSKQESWELSAFLISQQKINLITLPITEGFESDKFVIISEPDLVGERFARNIRKRKVNPEKFLAELQSFDVGTIIVHEEHGIGRFEGLETLEIAGTRHDCLKITYAGNDLLYLPVENIDLISRYGDAAVNVELDSLGAASWQSRKANIKKRIRMAAAEIIKLAANRQLQTTKPIEALEGLYDEFCTSFPYTETEDQIKAVEDVAADLRSGKPMNRLICGDVGFGKTEVALRAAFIALGERVAGGYGGLNIERGGQIAIITPTTLLCQQHYHTFKKRFSSLPVNICQLSRLVNSSKAKEIREGMENGDVDIIIGTHALLSNKTKFNNLALLIIDEEQHFGVKQKEKLKKMQEGIHVLTLSATPIPRTMQMSLAGMRELSLIATPPVDRLAVRTYVMGFDAVVIREAIMREKARGGRIYYVCPRIKDIEFVKNRLEKYVPEASFAIAHGKLRPNELDKVIGEFDAGIHDILLCTTIVESGLDIPTANTLIVHKSEMFGLSQLYQLRGRVGRSNIRAYAYFTVHQETLMTKQAMQRLEVMQKLDSLGAGFSIASYDMDIRGFGNLLGEEQSGNIKEVGVELYQKMLQEAIAEIKDEHGTHEGAVQQKLQEFSPQIKIGISVLIPKDYIPDLPLRLSMYRKIADLKDETAIDQMMVELVDRFGKIPEEVEHLIEIVRIKQLCRKVNISKLDAGEKGMTISFYKNKFAKPETLLKFISENASWVKLRPDQKLVFTASWKNVRDKIEGVKRIIGMLVSLSDNYK